MDKQLYCVELGKTDNMEEELLRVYRALKGCSIQFTIDTHTYESLTVHYFAEEPILIG